MKANRKRKKSNKSLSGLKKEAWSLLSKCIRLGAANHEGYCECVTCGDFRHWQSMHAGHFIDGRHGAVLFDERGIHVQCPACNLFLSGNKISYTLFMQKKYGQELVDELLTLGKGRGPIKKWTRIELSEMIESYKDRLERLEARARRVCDG